jgi:hypothetical protein
VCPRDDKGDTTTMEIADGHREPYHQGDAASWQVWLSPGLSAPRGDPVTDTEYAEGF